MVSAAPFDGGQAMPRFVVVGKQFGGFGQPFGGQIKIAEHFGQLTQPSEGLALLARSTVESGQGLEALQRDFEAGLSIGQVVLLKGNQSHGKVIVSFAFHQFGVAREAGPRQFQFAFVEQAPAQKMVGGGVLRGVLQRLFKIGPGFAVPLFLVQAEAVQKGGLPIGGILVQNFLQTDPGGSGGSGSEQVQNLPQITAEGRGGAFGGGVGRFVVVFGGGIGALVAAKNEAHHRNGQDSPFRRGAIT